MSKSIIIISLAFCLSGCGNKQSTEQTAKIIPVKVMNIGFSDQLSGRNYVGTVEETLAVSLSFSGMGTVRLCDDYYQAGTGLLTELLDAQNSLQQACDQHTEAATGYRMTLSKYRQATGQL